MEKSKLKASKVTPAPEDPQANMGQRDLWVPQESEGSKARWALKGRRGTKVTWAPQAPEV